MGVQILKYKLPLVVDAGIRQEVLPGFVSEYECRTCAKEYGYTWQDWVMMDTGERAMCVAHARVSSAISAHVSDAHQKYSDRQARNVPSRRR